MKKTGLSLSCLLVLVVLAMGGCIGYAGPVGPSDGGANTRTAAGLSVNPVNLSFGSVVVGTNSAQSVSVTNGGRAAVVLSSINSSNPSFMSTGVTLPTRIAAGQSVSFKVNFAPRKTGDFSGTIAVANSASGTPTNIAVSGTSTQQQQPGIIAASSTALSLGNVTVGSTATQSFSVTNTGGMTAILSGVSSSSTTFVAAGPVFPMDIKPGQSVLFTVVFTPTTAGAATGVITVSSNASNAPTTIGVSATGTAAVAAGKLSASAASLSVGSVNVGSTGSQTFSVTNSGGTAVTLSSLSSSAAVFSATGPTFPMSLAAGQSVSVKVVFAPTTAGNASGTITLASNASNAPTAIAVTGTGVTAAAAPTISSQPAAQSVLVGQTATFAVTAAGTAPLTYQWKKNGNAISGATSASYTTAAETTSDNGASFTVSVSNNAGTVTSNAAALTVSAATLSLSATPASLSFGSVNVGGNSAQSVTFTNTGNSNITISNVSVSGAGFNATGISSGQVVAPGKTAALNVTFAPGSGGALSGSVTVASNATNSPLAISLSGTGAAAAPPAVSGAPTCGKNNDTNIEVPSDWSTFVPPAKGHSYVDPTFGCTVTRITDASSQDWQANCNGGAGCYMPLNMGYATVSPFNADDTKMLLSDGWNQFFVTDVVGNILVPIGSMPKENDGWELWDAANPNVFYYTNSNSLMQGTISGSTITTSTLHQFSEYSGINFMAETDVSQDGNHMVIVGQNASNTIDIFSWNMSSNLKGPVYTTSCTMTDSITANPEPGCLHKLIQTPDNNVIIQFAEDGAGSEQGNRLWEGINPLPALQDSTNHFDSGYDLNGSSVFIEIGNSTVLPGETNPCPSGWGTDVRMIYNVMSAVCLVDSWAQKHVSYRGNVNQPWVGISYFDAANPSAEWFDNSTSYTAPTAADWYLYEDEITLIRVDANNNSNYIYRLARAYSRSDEDFYAQPHGALSRDGKYIAFNSNMAYAHTGCPANFQTPTGCTDVYVIKIK